MCFAADDVLTLRVDKGRVIQQRPTHSDWNPRLSIVYTDSSRTSRALLCASAARRGLVYPASGWAALNMPVKQPSGSGVAVLQLE